MLGRLGEREESALGQKIRFAKKDSLSEEKKKVGQNARSKKASTRIAKKGGEALATGQKHNERGCSSKKKEKHISARGGHGKEKASVKRVRRHDWKGKRNPAKGIRTRGNQKKKSGQSAAEGE